MYAQDGRVGGGADIETRRDERAIVLGLRIDMFDAIDALDDRLQRLGDELDGILRLQPVSGDANVDHRHRDLRLLLSRQRDEGDQPERKRGQQEQWRER